MNEEQAKELIGLMKDMNKKLDNLDPNSEANKLKKEVSDIVSGN